MPAYHTRLEGVPFVPGGHPLEKKQLGADPKVLRLRFEPGFEDPNVCERGHVILVEQGTLSIELDGEVLTAEKGEVVRLTPGTRHRAANRSSVPTELLIISDLTEVAPV
ncbi:MAG: hypothetical protein B6A08_13740 [Sorangiineae bacterium NIC37A_2]|jgi:quercetin dioxygenase-like cupin family protein|nr:MAG: hypothetical protein B6A08_13740 [Sorangiineae bacterium NIC37A_2]